MQFSISRVMGEGWDALKRNYGFFVAVTLVYLVLSFALSFVGQVFVLLGLLAQLLVTPALTGGLTYAAVRGYRGRGEVNDLFRGFPQIGGMIVIYLVTVVASLVAGFPLLIGVIVILFSIGDDSIEQKLPLIIGCFLVGLITMWIATCRLFFAYGIAIQKQVGPIEALKESWVRTGPYIIPLFFLYLFFSFMAGFGLVCFILPGLLLFGPWALASLGASYYLIIGDTEAQQIEAFE